MDFQHDTFLWSSLLSKREVKIRYIELQNIISGELMKSLGSPSVELDWNPHHPSWDPRHRGWNPRHRIGNPVMSNR